MRPRPMAAAGELLLAVAFVSFRLGGGPDGARRVWLGAPSVPWTIAIGVLVGLGYQFAGTLDTAGFVMMYAAL